ncbi:transcriptional regulator [Bacteroidia bacterium]|nr:transcriptional regulator [Bacteroidia bacterium]
MTIQQIEYLIAIDETKNFVKASEKCFVTQPALSLAVQKLEDELGVKLIDRTKHPVELTSIGKKLVLQAKKVVLQFGQIKEIVAEEVNSCSGKFSLGVIPTVATYIVPMLFATQNTDYQNIELIIRERTTENCIAEIRNGELDAALLATPLYLNDIVEYPIYYEKFYAYVSHDKKFHQKHIDLNKVSLDDLWLLEEEHCLRGQIINLCRMKRESLSPIKYESGSIETLLNIVDNNKGLTIIPEMNAMSLSEERQDNLRFFKNTTAVREISLIVSEQYIRKKLLSSIIEMIKKTVPKSMQDPQLKRFSVPL